MFFVCIFVPTNQQNTNQKSTLTEIMKTIFAVLLCLNCSPTVMAQNLSTMSATQRDSTLLSIAKEVVLRLGPDYYREHKPPIINRREPRDIDLGRAYYMVVFPFDIAKERLRDYAASVGIWEDNGRPTGVAFGNGTGIFIPEDVDWREWANTISPTPYQEMVGTIRIRYDDQGEPISLNGRPTNKQELLQRGWERDHDGQWRRTRPDTPPEEAQRVIRRAQEDMRKRDREREEQE